MSDVNSFLGSDVLILNNNLCSCGIDGEGQERRVNQAYKESLTS